MLVEKINELFVLPTLANYCFVTSSFDLWMLKGAYDILPLLLSFWGSIGIQNILQLCFLEHLISLGMH
jgi:hypothetical protein